MKKHYFSRSQGNIEFESLDTFDHPVKTEIDLELGFVQKLSPFQAYVSLVKAFCCTGVLYLPKAYVNGGWLMTSIMLAISAMVSYYCGILLIDVRKKLRTPDFSTIGELTYGKPGRIAVDISVYVSQFGFCCAYVYFIKQNLHQVFL